MDGLSLPGAPIPPHVSRPDNYVAVIAMESGDVSSGLAVLDMAVVVDVRGQTKP